MKIVPVFIVLLLCAQCSPGQKSPPQVKDSVPAKLEQYYYYEHLPEYTFFDLDPAIPPDSIRSLTLDVITLATGFPEQVYTYKNLETLYFEGISENTRLDERILLLTKLKHVTFKGRFEKVAVAYDSTISLVCRLPSLETLELQSLLDLPFIFPRGSQLKQLYISNSGKKTTDAFIRMDGMENLLQLEILTIVRCCMTKLPDGIFQMKKLRKLQLSANFLPQTEETPTLRHFRIDSMPLEINNMVDLEELILFQAGVKSIELDPKRLTKLEKFNLSGNCFSKETHEKIKADFPAAKLGSYSGPSSLCE
jgi:Leucine-rich repeat (LRR) protein